MVWRRRWCGGQLFLIIRKLHSVWLYVLRYIPLNIAYPLSRVVDILVRWAAGFFSEN